jgi:hypothetical protein
MEVFAASMGTARIARTPAMASHLMRNDEIVGHRAARNRRKATAVAGHASKMPALRFSVERVIASAST